MDPFSLPMKVMRVSWGWREGSALREGGDSEDGTSNLKSGLIKLNCTKVNLTLIVLVKI